MKPQEINKKNAISNRSERPKTITVFENIKKQCSKGKALTIPEQRYLVAVIENISSFSVSPNDAIEHTKLISLDRGKKTLQYQTVKHARDLKLIKAVSLLEGSKWGRCAELISIIQDIDYKHEYISEFKPKNEIERLIVNIISSGIKMPGSIQGLYNTLKIRETER